MCYVTTQQIKALNISKITNNFPSLFLRNIFFYEIYSLISEFNKLTMVSSNDLVPYSGNKQKWPNRESKWKRNRLQNKLPKLLRK